ncbi:MAG: exodeoxyribonuclease VII large subunit [Candidatus Kerfeldbacteria bacterium]|nr:exodeoxyribonuclease VII large subunit [Candidatus Kerfeldbacteria bacterium]
MIFSVSEFVDYLREHLRTTVGEVEVKGEVSGFRERGDSLVFFDLKDEGSAVTCFLMKWELKQELADGEEIRVLATPSLFKKSGKFHLRVKEIALVGEGALAQAFLKLKSKLEQEGLFDEARKRPLPRFPERIGLVTSADAAAYTDVLTILKDRSRQHTVVFAPVRVQGAGSVRDIVAALRTLNEQRAAEVIIVTRGGGSFEDLQSFNSEDVARAIVASRIPVVVGVGHERDTSIADLVADVRATTPTNAAQLVAPDRRELLLAVTELSRRLGVEADASLRSASDRVGSSLDRMQRALQQPIDRIEQLLGSFRAAAVGFAATPRARHVAVDHAAATLTERMRRRSQEQVQRLAHIGKLLHALSPNAVLARGFSLTFDGQGKILHDAKALATGDHVRTRLSKGEFDSAVL